MKLSCLFKRHRRSASRAYVDGPVCRSLCSDCGVPLVRVASKRWVESAHDRPRRAQVAMAYSPGIG